MANYKIEDIEGIGEVTGKKFREAGVKDTDALLAASTTPSARAKLAEATGLSTAQVLKFANMADLYRIHGVGSICEPHFEGQGRVATPITEVRIDHGRLRDGRAEIEISHVDTGWTTHQGRLVRGLNPVGVTFELLLEGTA